MYKKSKLKNGVRIILAPMKSTKTVTVLVMVGTGSKNENEKNRGISHFLEHMFFKGTKKRPTTLDISKELDSIGGIYNAFTGKECTGFWAKVDSKHCDLALDVVSDMLLNSNFDADEIKREKGTILEELNMYLDNPIMHVSDLFENLLYKKQPLGYDELGNKKTISSVVKKDFLNYYKKYYTGNNTVIVIAGNFNEKEIKNKIKKYFNITRKNATKKYNRTYDKQTKPNIFLEHKKTDQTHLCLGVRGYNVNHKDKYILSVLSIILGGNMSSRLFISVREKRGLAYYIYTSSETYKDVGYLVARSGVNNKKCLEAIKIILDEFKKVKEEKISAEEIKRAKDYLKGQAIISLESSNSVANFFAGQELSTGKILTPEEKFAKIDAVTADDLQRVARDIFVNDKLNLALIGPFKNKKAFEKILKF
ncbi:insulinase family protein [Candidatus Parcubacteria bacterium]|nr:insulinase family protein [Candidatus Parcubacteria bacterium]